MALDRSKFKATKVATMVAKDKEVESALGKTRGERADTLTIEEGKNKFRLYPPHPEDMGGGDVFAEPVVRCFLPMMVEEKDKEGKVVMEGGRPKMKETAKPIFNSRIHGDTEKDAVEEYRKYAERKAKELFGEDAKKIEAYLTPIKGKFSKVASERVAGIQDRQTWVAYADKLTEDKNGEEKVKFGRLEFNVSVKTRLNKLSAMEGGNEPLGTDPFTDPEGGRAVIVDYNKAASKPADYYTTEMDTTTVKTEINGKMYPVQKEYPLTDEQLENFLKYPTLKSLFRNAFKRRDFELQLKGLEFFDKKYKMGIWEDPEWTEILEEISAYYPEESEEDEEDGDGPMAGKVTSKVTEVEENEEEEGDEFDTMDRSALKVYIKENDLGIVATTKITDDKLRQMIREAIAAAETDSEEEEEEEQEEKPEEKKEEKKSDMAARLAALRAKSK